MNILSLCDGMSCGQIALKELNIKVDNYFASEIKDIAIKVTKDNFPNTIFLGDVKNIHYKDGNQNELERCQTVPEGYTKCLTRNQAANVLSDGWTIEVIKYILEGFKKNK